MSPSLTIEDFRSSTWRTLKAIVEDRLKNLREKNDSVSLTAEQTFALRGQIAMCKEILALPNDGSAGQEAAPGFQSSDGDEAFGPG